jgi:rifampicin phosphotransferase
MPVPTSIPLPENFPIRWEAPELAMLPFQQDRQHLPNPITPLSAWFAANGFAVGASRAMADYSVPMSFTVAHLNYYYYMAIAPNVPPEQMPEHEERAQAALMPAVMSFRARWEQEWLPELQRTWDDWAKFDLSGAPLPHLIQRLDECEAVFQRIWEVHFMLLIPAFVGFSEFLTMYGGLFPGSGELEPYRLLQGFDNKSLEADRAFWALSRRVAAQPALVALFNSTASGDVGSALRQTPEGRAFLEEATSVLAEFGRRSDTVQELGDPSWVEDPRPLFANIKSLLEKGDDPHKRLAAMAAEREAAIASARAKLADHPPEVRGQFEGLLFAAQNCSFLQEDHNYWIDQRGLHEVRQVCLEVGRRLAAEGKLASADDVFMFSVPELRELAAGLASGVATASKRQAEMVQWATVTPPPMVGTDYGPPPDNPIARAIVRFFGRPPLASEKTIVRGNAGSSGKVRGIARLVMTIDDADRLAPGEILVAPTTSPPWTPLFATAAGIVTDTGGSLSHCAIVAREYGIPAVVGTGAATVMIRDGQEIEVDGDAGVVTLY